MKLDEDLKRKKPDGFKAHRDFLLQCLLENQDKFRQLLWDAAEEDPKFFLKISVEIAKHLIPRQQDVNVNLTLNQDFQALQALSSTSASQKSLGYIERIGVPALESLQQPEDITEIQELSNN